MPARTLQLPSGRKIPALGLGTWYLGKDAGAYYKELKLIEQAIDIGYRFFDTAELYGNGGAEEILGDAIQAYRSSIFLSSKVSPEYISHEEIVASCERTLKRVKTDYLDMYLLHWRGNMGSLEEVVDAFLDLKQEGKIRDFGVCNFDHSDMEEWMEIDGAEQTAMNQGYYNLANRTLEQKLSFYCEEKGIPFMAYAALKTENSLFQHPVLVRIASDRGVTPRQIAHAWTLSRKNVGVLTMSEDEKSLIELYETTKIHLTPDEIAILDLSFPLYK